MGSSDSPSRSQTVRLSAVVFLISAAVCVGASVNAAERVELHLLEAPDEVFASGDLSPTISPGPGQVVIFGEFGDVGGSVENISQISVVTPGGGRPEVIVETGGVFYEWDRIVAVRMCFMVPEDQVSDAAGALALVWGPDVASQNREVERIVLDPAHRERSFEFRTARKTVSREESVAQIEVVADSAAGYYFLWYLLPIAVIFTLLTIRKIRAGHVGS